MKIIFLCRLFHQFRGGLESYTYEMAQALAKRGHHVHIICEDKGNFYRHHLGAGIEVHAIPYNEDPFPGFWKIDRFIPLQDIFYSRKVAQKIQELIDRVGVDIVEAPDVQEQGFWYSQHKRTAFFLRLHGYFYMREGETLENSPKNLPLREQFFWWIERSSIFKADGVAAVSSDFAEFVRRFWNLDGKKIEVIHNAVDTAIFHGASERSEQREQRELAVLFVGRIEPKKGIKVLARAIPIVLKEFPNVKFYFAGRDTHLENSSEMASEYILRHAPPNNVVFLGELPTPELIPYYQKIAIGVFPSLYEPFGLVALESMACGCATIVSQSGGLSDIIEHERDGLLVAPGNPFELAQAIKRFLNDNQLRERCCVQAIEKVRTQFTLDELVDRTLFMYEQAIHNYRH